MTIRQAEEGPLTTDSTPVATPLVPPRPNLGPEPMPGPAPVRGLTVAVGLTLALALLVLLARRVFRRRARSRPGLATAAQAVPAPDNLPPYQRRMIAWSEAVRLALMKRFGPPWAAKTTEEIAADAELAGALDADRRAHLVRFLRAADRTKFAAEPDQGEDWDAWVGAFVAGLAAPSTEAGARSRIKGR